MSGLYDPAAGEANPSERDAILEQILRDSRRRTFHWWREQAAVKHLRAAEQAASAAGPLVGPVLRAQRQASLAIDRAVRDLDVLDDGNAR